MNRNTYRYEPKNCLTKTLAPQTYTFDDLEMTDALGKAIWNVVLISEEKGKAT
jgi:hypothetical protein